MKSQFPSIVSTSKYPHLAEFSRHLNIPNEELLLTSHRFKIETLHEFQIMISGLN